MFKLQKGTTSTQMTEQEIVSYTLWSLTWGDKQEFQYIIFVL